MYILNNLKRFIKTFSSTQVRKFRAALRKDLLLNPADVKEIEVHIERMKSKVPPQVYSNGSDFRWHDLKSIDKVYFEGLFCRLCSQVGLECNDYNFFVMYNETRYVENGTGSGDGWHFDSTAHQRKFIFYMSDVDENNGPFQYIKETYSLRFIRRYLLRNLLSEKILRLKGTLRFAGKITEILGHSGSGFLIATSVVHRGKPIISGSRRAITFYMFEGEKISDNFKHYI